MNKAERVEETREVIKLIKKLTPKWLKIHKVYQKESRMHRLQFFLKFIHHFEGKNVLELGSNAGVYGYAIAKVARSYIGVDRGECYIKQAKITRKEIKNEKVKFICCSVKDFIKMDIRGETPAYNALFASFVLYHLSKKETDRITQTVLPECDVVIIQTRTKKRTPFKKYNPHKFNKPKNVERWLTAAGFTCKTKWAGDKRYADTVAIRERACKDCMCQEYVDIEIDDKHYPKEFLGEAVCLKKYKTLPTKLKLADDVPACKMFKTAKEINRTVKWDCPCDYCDVKNCKGRDKVYAKN